MSSLKLDNLADKSYDELDALYANGTVPSDFKELAGKPKGRMLAVRGVSATPLNMLVKLAAKLPVFPWDGKSMGVLNDHEGTGINRVKFGVTMDWFPFTTRVVKSVIDGKDTILLDYEQPGNPIFIRKIRDELRKVSPGLFLGPAMWKVNDHEAHNVLWFALDTSDQS